MKGILTTLLRTLFFLSIGIGLLYYVFQKQGADWDKLRADFASVNYFWIAVVVLCFLISNVSRVWRWQLLVTPMGYQLGFKNAFLSTLSCYFANAIVPRSGEVLRPVLVARYEKLPFEKLFGTVAVDRIVDTISFLSVTALGFLLEYKLLYGYLQAAATPAAATAPTGISMTKIIFMAAVGAGITLLLLSWVFRARLQQLSIYKVVREKVLGFLEGLQSIRKIDNIGAFIFHSLTVWIMFYLMIYFGFKAFAPTAGFDMRAALLIMVFGSFGMVIPTPGGIGSYQFLVTTALTVFYKMAPAEAFSFSNIMFFTQYFTNLGFGFLAYLLLPLVNEKLLPAAER